MARHLVRMMGGEIGVKSAPNEGTTFWFTAAFDRPHETADAAEPFALAGLRALVVDDLPQARSALVDGLRLLGLEVEEAETGQAALIHVQDRANQGRPYDVILLDWRMESVDSIETLNRMHALLGAGVPPSILVAASGEEPRRESARTAQFDEVLVKPVTASALHDALVGVLCRRQRFRPAAPSVEGETAARLRQLHGGRRVLVAEDNPVNQEVVAELLRIAGLTIDVVADGASAVQFALTHSYDLVLMDVQMPGLDGLEATRAIRAGAASNMPIIAMTANAFSEDRAACLNAGMNDHLTKPIDPEVLYATLLRWLSMQVPSRREAPTPTQRDPGALDDSHALLGRLESIDGLVLTDVRRSVGGDRDLLKRLLGTFAANYRAGCISLGAAIQSEDALKLRNAIHSLRGACATVGAIALAEQFLRLEAELRRGAETDEVFDSASALDESVATLATQIAVALAAVPPA